MKHMGFNAYSLAFDEGGTLSLRHTADGDDESPPLAWLDPPEETRSFAVICVDPDAPRGPFFHWAVFDIPADARGLSGAVPATEQVGRMRQAYNSFGRLGYGGPTPPPSHRPHRYTFRIYALRVERLDVSAYPQAKAVQAAATAESLAEVSLTATYGRRLGVR